MFKEFLRKISIPTVKISAEENLVVLLVWNEKNVFEVSRRLKFPFAAKIKR